LGGSKLEPPQRFSGVMNNVLISFADQAAELALCAIMALLCR
jgi:hypothetical protein